MKQITLILSLIIITASFTNGQEEGLNDLIESAITTNSRLSPIEYKRMAELTRKNQLSMQPSPMFEFLTEMIPVNLDARPTYRGMFSQELVLSNRLGERGLLGEVGAREQELIKDKVRLELVRDVKLNYFGLYLMEKMLDFNHEYQEIILNVIRSQEINYAVGRGVQNQIFKSNNEFQMLQLEAIELEANRKTYINNLSLLSNQMLDTGFATRNIEPLKYTNLLELDTVKLISDMISNNPEFKLINNMIEQNRIEKNISRYEKTPDIMLKAGYSYNAQMYKSFIMLGLGVSLPFVPWNSKRINARIEEAELQELKYTEEYKSTVQYMVTEMVNTIVNIEVSQDKALYIMNVLLPQTDRTFNSSLEAYVTATDDFLNLIDSYRTLRTVNLMLLKEEANYLKEISNLEFIIGKQILEIN